MASKGGTSRETLDLWAAGQELAAFLTPDGALQPEWLPPEMDIGATTARLQEEVFRRYESGIAVSSPSTGAGKRSSAAAAGPFSNTDHTPDSGRTPDMYPIFNKRRLPGRSDSLAWLLFLGFSDSSVPLSPSLTFWRSFGAIFGKELRLTPDLEELRGRAAPAVPDEELAALASQAPAAAGMEYLTPELLRLFWERLQRTFAGELEIHRGSVAAYFASLSPEAHCPSCHQKRVVEFGEWLCVDVLKKVPHRHFVFGIPKILRRYFLYDRKLLADLSRSAW